MSPVQSADTLQIKNFVEIALNRTISKINVFCVLRRNSRWPPKVAGKQFWGKSAVDSAYTLWIENFVEFALSSTVSKISFFAFYTDIQDGRQKWRQSDFSEKSPVHSADTLQIKILSKLLYLVPFPR